MITYQKNIDLPIQDIIRVFDASTISRPTGDSMRIEKMFKNSNLVLSAWHNEVLIGVCRALTDFSFCCYLSDLAVDQAYQHQGVGKTLIDLVHREIGPEVSLILLAAPAAIDYYPKVGFEVIDNGFIIKRQY
jgi:N-acetylglutamate synthase-like GNAT family acetyltransferase